MRTRDLVNTPLLFIDCETSGRLVGLHEIIELAMVKCHPQSLEVIEAHHARTKPTLPVDPEAARINGYTPEGWRDAEELEPVLRRMVPLLNGCRWVGSNPHFDFDFISAAAMANQVTLCGLADWRLVDVSSMAEPWICAGELPEGGLDNLLQWCGFEPRARPHSALTDAHSTRLVYGAIRKRIGLMKDQP